MSEQIPEKLRIGDLESWMDETPLEFWLVLAGDFVPREFATAYSTGCHRGYIGTWELVDNRLYLVELVAEPDINNVSIEKFFPGWSDRVFAHWYTGTLMVDYPHLLQDEYSGAVEIVYQSVSINIERGVVVSDERMKNIRPLRGQSWLPGLQPEAVSEGGDDLNLDYSADYDYDHDLDDCVKNLKVRSEHLKKRVGIERVLAEEKVSDPLGAVPKVPFGFLHFRWVDLTTHWNQGDELWTFEVHPVDFGYLRRGYAIVRSGAPMASFVTDIIWLPS